MKRVLLLLVLSCQFAVAQEVPKEEPISLLNYNYIGLSYSKTTYKGSTADLTGYGLSFGKTLTKSAYFVGGYSDSSQAVTNAKINLASIGLGFHTPISENVDAVVGVELMTGSVKVGAASTNINGNGLSLGIRALVTPKIELGLSGVYVSVTSGTVTTTDTQTSGSVGFNLSPTVQISAGVNFKSDQTVSIGARLFF